jgi:endonuclease YncB( thermonuclease family)
LGETVGLTFLQIQKYESGRNRIGSSPLYEFQAMTVSAGRAWADVAFGDQYVDAERRAAARGVGVHAHRCQPPWEWRALKRVER